MRRFSRRRRRGGMRWFAPETWSASLPADFSFPIPASPAFSDVSSVRLLKGSSPFPGVTNVAGLLAGKMLAERQWWSIRRLVGRLNWYVVFTDQVDLAGWFELFGAVAWGLIKWKVDEEGRPVGDLPGPFEFDDQDEKWLHMEVERFALPNPGLYKAGQAIPFDVGPWHGYHDIRVSRRMRNEEDLFLVAQANVCDQGGTITPLDDNWKLAYTMNWRALGRFS